MAFADLNSDLGESFGAYKIGADDKIIPLVTSVNIACGYHAGDPLVMQKSVALAKEYGATDIINYKNGDIVEQILDLNHGPVDKVILAGGKLNCIDGK